MKPESQRWSDAKIAALIFAVLLAALIVLDGNRLLLGTNDEGIYLDGAERMLHGERLYADFFGYMSPGAFWVQELFFRIFGVTMLAGRLPALIYFCSECALLYWLTARLASRGAAWAALLVFFAGVSSDLSFLTAQHRWDSGALALASIALSIQGSFSGRRFLYVAAGALAGAAAFFTPSMGLIAAVTLIWLLLSRDLRRHAVSYLAGGVAVSAVLVGSMAASGILIPFIGQMRWLQQNYSSVNVMAYGETIGGYRNLLAGPLDLSLALRGLVVLSLALPAILPPVNFAGWIAALALRSEAVAKAPERRAILYLLLCSAALILSTYPRPDLMHLTWIAPVTFVLTAALVALAAPRWLQAATLVLGIFGATFFLVHLAATLVSVKLPTPVGELRAAPEAAASVQAVLEQVQPGDTAFVYPYKPLLYFLTQTRNPSRYSYLQPGMMNANDEASTLASLRVSPPRWILYLALSQQEYLRVFPSADPARMHFPDLESWIAANYSPAKPAAAIAGYRLLRFSGSVNDR